MGVAFLSAAVGRLTILSEGSEKSIGIYCRNAMIPLSILSATLIAVPLKAPNPAAALKGVAPPLTATLALLGAHKKGWDKTK